MNFTDNIKIEKFDEAIEKSLVEEKKGVRVSRGRPLGSITTKTREMANKLWLEKNTPLQTMIKIMNRMSSDEELTDQQIKKLTIALDAAAKAAPYVHPRLSAIENTYSDQNNLSISSFTLNIVDPSSKSNKEAIEGHIKEIS